MSSIDRESDDIFAKGGDSDDESLEEEEESHFDEDATEGGEDEGAGELTAAVALTSLVGTEPFSSSSNYKESDKQEVKNAEDEEMELSIPQRFTKSGRKRAVSFPLKLMKVLSTKKHKDVIAWTPSGKAFEIRKSKQFAIEILPKYFKSAKYSSFTRKLHRWNFQRHYRGDEAGAYYHPDFIKGRLDLVERMRCKSESQPSAPKPKTNKPASSAPRKTASTKSKTKGDVKASADRDQSKPTQTVHIFPNLPPPPVVQPPTAVGLNAAIELEVARRLNERISAAAFSRQALAMLERQQQQQHQIQTALNALIERRYQALLGHQSNLAVPNSVSTAASAVPHVSALTSAVPAAPLPPQGICPTDLSLSSTRSADLAQIYNKFKPAPSYNYAFGDEAPALPPTNIQGARTA